MFKFLSDLFDKFNGWFWILRQSSDQYSFQGLHTGSTALDGGHEFLDEWVVLIDFQVLPFDLLDCLLNVVLAWEYFDHALSILVIWYMC